MPCASATTKRTVSMAKLSTNKLPVRCAVPGDIERTQTNLIHAHARAERPIEQYEKYLQYKSHEKLAVYSELNLDEPESERHQNMKMICFEIESVSSSLCETWLH
jgi:hypothetical protein